MTPFDDLEQFRALAQRLPEIVFDAGGVVHPRIGLFAATREQADIAPAAGLLADLPFDGDFTAAVRRADADLRLYELDLDHPAIALDPVDAARAAAYGMTAIEPGPDLFALAALTCADDMLADVERQLCAGDPLLVLARLGGRDTAALFGAIIAARMAGLPVIIDGPQAMAAVLVLRGLAPAAVSHCAVPQGSTVEVRARAAGLASVRCSDARPLHALASAIRDCNPLAVR